MLINQVLRQDQARAVALLKSYKQKTCLLAVLLGVLVIVVIHSNPLFEKGLVQSTLEPQNVAWPDSA